MPGHKFFLETLNSQYPEVATSLAQHNYWDPEAVFAEPRYEREEGVDQGDVDSGWYVFDLSLLLALPLKGSAF